MATKRNSLPGTEEQSEAVQILNQLMDTSEVLEVCREGTTESEVAIVSDSVKIHVDTTGQTAVEAIVINPGDETLNKQKQRPARAVTNIPTLTVPLIQDAIINRQPGELTPSMKLAIRAERTKRLKELLDSKLHNGLGLPKMKTWKRPKEVVKNQSQIGKGTKLLECSSSQKSFQTAKNLSKHQQTEHVENGLLDCEENVHRCGQCGHTSTDEISRKNHMLIHLIKEFICDICGESFHNRRGLTNHSVRHSKHRPFQCPLCNFSAKRKGDMGRHRRTHTSERPHVCTVCGNDFKFRNSFKTHMRTVHGIDPPNLPNKKFYVASPDRPHACHCGAAYKTVHSLRRHMKDFHSIHPEASPDRPHVCHCGADFKLEHNLRTHLLKIHGINAMPSIQPKKTRKAQEPKNLQADAEEQVDKDKTFECQPCKRSFRSAKTFSRHQQSDGHLEKEGKCHLCSFCGETFTRQWKLSDHQKLHTGDLHLCPHCGFQCTKRNTMNYHMKRHFPSNKKYVCDICGTSFFEKQKLKIHQAIHSDERPFKCDECEKAFKTTNLLKIHQGTHQTERSHICWCEASFKSKRALRVHSKKVHRTQEGCQQNGEVVEISLEDLTAQTTAKAAEETIHLAGGNKHRRTKRKENPDMPHAQSHKLKRKTIKDASKIRSEGSESGHSKVEILMTSVEEIPEIIVEPENDHYHVINDIIWEWK